MKQKTDPSNPIELDSDQLKNLTELIDSLKKDIIVPGRREKVGLSENSEREYDGSIGVYNDSSSWKLHTALSGGTPRVVVGITT